MGLGTGGPWSAAAPRLVLYTRPPKNDNTTGALKVGPSSYTSIYIRTYVYCKSTTTPTSNTGHKWHNKVADLVEVEGHGHQGGHEGHRVPQPLRHVVPQLEPNLLREAEVPPHLLVMRHTPQAGSAAKANTTKAGKTIKAAQQKLTPQMEPKQLSLREHGEARENPKQGAVGSTGKNDALTGRKLTGCGHARDVMPRSPMRVIALPVVQQPRAK